MEIKANNSYISKMKTLVGIVRVRNSSCLKIILKVSESAEHLKILELVSPYCEILIYLIPQLIRIIYIFDAEMEQDPMILAPMSSACLFSVEKL